MKSEIYQDVQKWMYQNARPIDLRLWQYFFENGTKESVIQSLMYYQNEDGGFGHALEADNWNPNSSPITTEHALKILRQIKFFDMSHPIYQGIWKYLNEENDLLEYGWRFTIPTNDLYPHAPWWDYNEESNKEEYYGVTADFVAFILEYGDKESVIYKKAEKLADQLVEKLKSDSKFGDMGLESYIILADVVKDESMISILRDKIKKSIEYDTTKWKDYGVRPSNYIKSPQSIFYEGNEEIIRKELNYLMDTKPENDVWGITWTWFDHMDEYQKEFAISENWWKGYRAVESMCLLHNFGMI